ncbi:DUF4254 domain-containing protein [Nocardia inohanensis]|uniref:DUF4254 domain-containing protein n=1 Tax=Nocardia inohanensis TaxID=209246 RepID=UPI00082DB2F8|nr:DUF4254 domain-containing protein [Nocardia inohanensis]
MSRLPSKDLLLEACAGLVHDPYPLLLAAYELASLHEARSSADRTDTHEIDCGRARLIHDIDLWVSRTIATALIAPSMHTESIGADIDRLAKLSVSAFAAHHSNTTDQELHHAWHRLAELSLGYGDLADDLTTGRRRLPTPDHPEESR